MPTKGTFTALQRLRPITEDFGQIALDAAARLEAQKAAKKAEEDAVKKAKAKIAKDFGQDYEGLVEVVTGTKSINEANARGINSARDSLGQIHKDIQSNPSLANDAKIQMKRANLLNFSKNLSLVEDRYTKYADFVGKGMQDGTLSDWNSNILSDLDSIFRQANLDIKDDPETGLPIAVIAVLDENGQPTGELKELNLIEILDGRGLSDTVNTFDFQKSVQDIGGKLGKREVKTPSGFSHIEYQKFSDIEPEVRAMLKGFVGNEKNPTDIAKSIWSDMMAEDPKELDAADMKRIEDFYVNSVKGFYDEKNKKTTDFGAIEKRATVKRKELEETGGGIRLRTDEKGKPTKRNFVGTGEDLQGPAHEYTLGKKVIFGLKGENRLVTHLFLTETGKVGFQEDIFTGKISGDKLNPQDILDNTIKSGEYTKKRRIEGGFNTDELNDLARKLGFNDAGELRVELERVRDDYQAKPKTDTKTIITKINTSKYN